MRQQGTYINELGLEGGTAHQEAVHVWQRSQVLGVGVRDGATCIANQRGPQQQAVSSTHKGVCKTCSTERRSNNLGWHNQRSSLAHTRTVDDADAVSDGSGHVGLQPGPQHGVDLLGLRWGRGLARADGPHGLVRHHNLVPLGGQVSVSLVSGRQGDGDTA